MVIKMKKGNLKYRRVGINENKIIHLSLTPNKSGTYNVFNEVSGREIGEFSESRLKSSFTDEQLRYVKKHGTTNFTKTGVWR